MSSANNDYALPALPGDKYYWELKRREGAYAWSDQLTIFRRRKYWFPKNCGSFAVNGTRMARPLTPDEILDKADEFVDKGLNGPLTPITGYRYEGTEY